MGASRESDSRTSGHNSTRIVLFLALPLDCGGNMKLMIVSGQSILRELGVEGCDIAEVEQVIGHNFPNWGGDRQDSQSLLFPGDQEAYAIKLTYDRKHRLLDALAGPALDEAMLLQIKSQIATGITDQGQPRVGSWVLFAPVPVTGAYRYRDRFQILPVPAEAPRPSVLWADHPFLLQFRYRGSTNVWVDHRRRTSEGRELELLLAGLLSSHIHSDRDQAARWVLPPDTAGPSDGARQQPLSALCQSSYFYPGMNGIASEFTSISEFQPFSAISCPEFLGRLGVAAGQVLDLPANFGQAIANYTSLTADQKLKFGNACYWVQHSARVYRESQSAAYIALALAIESLMPPPESGRTCECCHRSVGNGPTRHFKDFINRFVPAAMPFESQTKHLYEIRSKLAHGHALLISDRERLLAPALASFEDWQNNDYLLRLVRIALVNWLNENAHSNAMGDMSGRTATSGHLD
jgi:hypothetical protein